MALAGVENEDASPSHAIVPPSGWWKPESTLISVDLPAPFWPSRQCTSPGRTSRSTPSRARTPGNDLVMPFMVSSGVSGAESAMAVPLAAGAGRFQGRAEQGAVLGEETERWEERACGGVLRG